MHPRSPRRALAFALLLAAVVTAPCLTCVAVESLVSSFEDAIEESLFPPRDSGRNDVSTEGRYLYARITREVAETPPRYAASLPSVVARSDDWSAAWPPRDHVRDGICLGDPSVRERFVASVAAAAEGGASWEAMCHGYAELFERCRAPTFCPWVEEVLASEAPLAVRQVVSIGAAGCVGRIDDAWVAAEGMPPEALVGWYGELHLAGGDRPIPQPYVAALAKLVESGPSRCGDLGLALSFFSDEEDPATTEHLLALYERARAPETRAELVRVLGEHDDPRAKAIVRTACAGSMRDEWFCEDRGTFVVTKGEEPPPDTPEERERCVRESLREEYGELDAHGCLRRLAQLDRPRASALAREVLPRAEEPTFRVLASSLAHYADEVALERRLVEVGLLSSSGGPLPHGDDLPVAPEEILEERARAYVFDAEALGIPVEHDRELRHMAALANEVFAGALFDEVPPREGRPGYELVAYIDGERFITPAQDLGDWFDTDAMIGFLNALARDRGSQLRFVALAGTDQTVTVVVGHPDAIERAAAATLLPL